MSDLSDEFAKALRPSDGEVLTCPSPEDLSSAFAEAVAPLVEACQGLDRRLEELEDRGEFTTR